MQYENLVKDFAKRTWENHKLYSGNYEVTNLINSSLGLFIFPEQKFFDKILDSWVSVEMLSELIANTESNYDESLDLKNICRHIRNGIAHFRIKLLSNNRDEIVGIEIYDEYFNKQNKQYYFFKITLSVKTLEKLFIEFSDVIIEQRRQYK